MGDFPQSALCGGCLAMFINQEFYTTRQSWVGRKVTALFPTRSATDRPLNQCLVPTRPGFQTPDLAYVHATQIPDTSTLRNKCGLIVALSG
jgi:hypothetical protein